LRLDISVYVIDALAMNNINPKAVADEFGMSVEKFLHLYRTRGLSGLPGQINPVSGRRFYEEQDASESGLDFDLTRLQKSWAWKGSNARLGSQRKRCRNS